MEEEEADQTTIDLARVMYDSAVLRSGFALKDSGDFASRIERMLRLSLDVDVEAEVSITFICTSLTPVTHWPFLVL